MLYSVMENELNCPRNQGEQQRKGKHKESTFFFTVYSLIISTLLLYITARLLPATVIAHPMKCYLSNSHKPAVINSLHLKNTTLLRSCRSHRYYTNYQWRFGPAILIIVNYHRTHYNNTVFFDNDYFPLFCEVYKYDYDVLYVGPSNNDTFRILGNEQYTNGRLSYHSVRVAWDYLGFNSIDNYYGMLFMNDDSYVDALNLNEMNVFVSYHEPPFPQQDHWGAWERRFAEANGTMKENAIPAFDAINTDTFLRDICGEWRWSENGHGWSDFFYIPAKQIPIFLRMESILFSYNVYLEVAVHNALICLSKHSIRNCNHWYCVVSYYEYTHIHPVKYHLEENRYFAISLLTRNISRYDRWHFNNGKLVIVQSV